MLKRLIAIMLMVILLFTNVTYANIGNGNFSGLGNINYFLLISFFY